MSRHSSLHISEDPRLPVETVTQAFAILPQHRSPQIMIGSP